MKLGAIAGAPGVISPAAAALEVSGVTADSRAVRPGMVFFAIPGTRIDGAGFAAQAAVAGAVAVVAAHDASLDLGCDIPVLRVADPHAALAKAAAQFYGAQPETVVAITGTNGKTSVADFTRQIYAALGHQAASLGTIGVVKPSGAVYGSLTTPDPVKLHETLAELAKEGVSHLALEASSHGLDQRRLEGVRLAAGAFTNLGHDHLDYHPSVEDYLAAKLRLFGELLQPGQPAVINADGPFAERAIEVALVRGLQLITTGTAGETLRLIAAEPRGFSQSLTVGYAGRDYRVELPLLGDYQASNALLAAGLAIATGGDPEAVLATLPLLVGVKGRLEVVGSFNGGIIVIDYAHKPEALEAALAALRPFASGRLISLFGCGGDRDRGKRPMMGRISVANADLTIVTDDNPRSEQPAAIRAEIMAGAIGAREIGDRGAAIREAVRLVGAGDVLLVAGKGHETGQIIGDVVHPFSDHEAVAQAMAAIGPAANSTGTNQAGGAA